jgi:hypothetical protein
MGSWGWEGYGKYCAVVREGGKSIQNCCVPSIIISSDVEGVGEEGEKSIEASEEDEDEDASRGVASAGSWNINGGGGESTLLLPEKYPPTTVVAGGVVLLDLEEVAVTVPDEAPAPGSWTGVRLIGSTIAIARDVVGAGVEGESWGEAEGELDSEGDEVPEEEEQEEE